MNQKMFDILRNAEVTTGSEAFKESVKFIDFRAIDPEHELSEEDHW